MEVLGCEIPVYVEDPGVMQLAPKVVFVGDKRMEIAPVDNGNGSFCYPDTG